MLRKLALAALIMAVSAPNVVRADMTFGFDAITINSLVDPGIGETQMFVTIGDGGNGRALFTFNNLGPAASSITDIYFDNGSTLASIFSIDNSDPGVSFGAGASPPNLPSGSNVGFSADFAVDSNSPVSSNGVNPGESVGIVFDLTSGTDLDGVIDELISGALRVGIHVQAFADGQSESFVNDPPKTPAPGAALLGLLGFTLISRRNTHMVSMA